jgi:prepilin-type N-terminal cleavage/methylation domain-containing protein
MSKNVRRRGFTLPEVLVTITIIAVLAAVVVPAVLNQVSKGDTASFAGDVDALKTAISNFTTDTRHYPASIHDLVSRPLSTEDDLFGSDYGTTAINAWKGPYFPISQDTTAASLTTNGYVMSAYNLSITNALDKPDTNGSFITIHFTGSGVSATNVATLDRVFDGGDGTVPIVTCATTATGDTLGAIRWTQADPASPTAGDPCDITNFRWRLLSAAR